MGKQISNTKEGKCVECGKQALLDANNVDKRYVCEDCWFMLGYHRPTTPIRTKFTGIKGVDGE